MGAALDIRQEEPEFTIGVFENSLLWCFRGPVTLARIETALPVHEELKRRYPKGFAVVTVIGEAVPLSMPVDARDLSTRITREYQPSYCAISEVVLGTGFRSAAVRSVTAGIRLLARSSCPAKVFGDVESCAHWLAPLMLTTPGHGALATALTAALHRVSVPR
jgi:hypothetical protein